MSEDQKPEDQAEEQVEETTQPVKENKPAKPRAPSKVSLTRNAKGEPADIKGDLSIVCSDRVTGTMFDNDRNVRIPAAGQNPVAVTGVTAGSWLWCQIDAGLIIKIGK